MLFSFFFFQDTDEEVERSYEQFYEDVHTEFLKYGEIVNFKVIALFLINCIFSTFDMLIMVIDTG